MKKKLGQHFLKAEHIIRKVVDALVLKADVPVVEIGPGKGALTERLLEKGVHVVAVEKDEELVAYLETLVAEAVASGQLTVVPGDIRNLPFMTHIGNNPYVVIANIPYYITGTILRDLLSHQHPPTAMALVMQKEVAERIVRRKDNKESLLSLSVQLFGTPTYVQSIPPRCFSPPPAVASAILTITDIQPVEPVLQEMFFSIVKTAFGEKRKTVLKKFKEQDGVVAALRKAGVDDKTRAEDIPFAVWHRVTCAQVGSV